MLKNWIFGADQRDTHACRKLLKERREALAALEGEGDLSLDYWRRAHKPFFIQECERCGQSSTTEMPVVCEEFKLVWPPDRVTERDKRL